MATSAGPVEVLLWDCDGVLQHTRRDWWRHLDEVGGASFARRVFEAEQPALRGEEPLAVAMARACHEHEAATGQAPATSVADLLAVWEHVELDEGAVDVLQAVRRRGVRCYLATNQHDHRVRHMREVMGYDALVDGAFYSSVVGVKKPDEEFFERVLAALDLAGDESHRVGFVDDVPANVAAARRLGIRAVHHDPASGVAGLVTDLVPLVPGLGLSPGPA